MKMATWKRWILMTMVTGLLFCGVVAGVNYSVDPLWCFNHGAFFGKYQPMFDERQQKTDWLTFHDIDLDTVILGNSRVTYMDTRSLPGKAFNYAASSMKPSEFKDYLSYASQRSRSGIKTVILGVSFAATNGANRPSFEEPLSYITKANSCGFRLRNLLSLSLFRYSFNCIKRNVQGNAHNCYVRQGNNLISKQMELPIPTDQLQRAISQQLATYANSVYGGNYRYRDNTALYRDLQETFPEIRFIVFITPVTRNLLELLAKEKRLDDYERWVSDLVDSFGEIWNFMYRNSVTENNDLFKDAHHYSPEVAGWIAQKIMGQPYDGPSDFGVRVTRENLAEHLRFLRSTIR